MTVSKKRIIEMHYEQGMNTVEIARQLHCSNQWVSRVLIEYRKKQALHPYEVGHFEKVSKERFVKAWRGFMGIGAQLRDIEQSYAGIKLPKRATEGSAGYDFFLPMKLFMRPGDNIIIPSGIRCQIKPGWALLMIPKSGIGAKYNLQLSNTVGLIDSDYYQANNEGHIMIALRNAGYNPLSIDAGRAIMQGVFIQHGITDDDYTTGKRTGGFGSTNA